MLFEKKGIADLENLIILQHIKFEDDVILIHFNHGKFDAWLENTNKHIPEIYDLKKESEGVFSFKYSLLPETFTQTSLRLSVSNETERLNYLLSDEYLEHVVVNNLSFTLRDSKGFLTMLIRNKNELFWSKKLDLASLHHSSSNKFEKVECLSGPVKVGVIGSCFSRSIFRSEDYFNPDYKEFCTVPLTFFHSSLISLMSKRVENNDYLQIPDLLSYDVLRYIEVEFLKNIKERIRSAGVEYIIIDNYSDAALEVIMLNEFTALTYNKYFSESIYKKNFSGKEILVPGEKKHIETYRAALKKFFLLLQDLNLDKRVILVGGRLSEFRAPSERWESKMDWIKNTNRNWDIYDAIFLDNFKNAQYIDMRSTSWISDVNSPITGGASPSHYQSGFYKELYKNTLRTIYTKQ
ncbi:DUF6270 domain-containing protein [Providencia rettgeri]|uniref:DUF6270 domain-containing protein n=1 Tax=Moellerella wisconsensis TaxID=158849 RepID=A0ACD3YCN7_9GAMM|nr:DUF6270 domain-containing protein [Moellerella wisconsensis]UNH28974.1 DUF6270 domain-containing protein [Moellerella wisconsensis]UNH40745.1 DUF6270 domain-containing protein [Moellerella wisconsensis]UNH44187.1 DUF6270 domain-containing protein [Moellerella wisconsensis]